MAVWIGGNSRPFGRMLDYVPLSFVRRKTGIHPERAKQWKGYTFKASVKEAEKRSMQKNTVPVNTEL